MIAKHIAPGKVVAGTTPSGRPIEIWLPRGQRLPVAERSRDMVIVKTDDGSRFRLPRSSVRLWGR